MRARLLVVVAMLVAWGVPAVACGCGGHDAPPRPPRDDSPVPRPAAVLAEASLTGGDAELALLRDALPEGAVRDALPSHGAGVLRAFCPSVPESVASRVGQARVSVVSLRDGHLVAGAALRVEAGERPLGGGVRLDAEDADGVRVLRVPTAPHGLVALRGDVLVCGDDAAATREALPYVARTLPSLTLAEGVVGAAADGAAAHDGRTWLDGRVRALAAVMRRSARAALEAHDVPPELGDPVALVDVLAARASALVAYAPDVGAVDFALVSGPEGLHLVVEARMRAGSPLDRDVQALASVPREELAALPEGTALGVVVPDRPTDGTWALGDALADDLARVGGARLSDGDAVRRSALSSALASLRAARGTATRFALGSDATGPFASLDERGGHAPDLAPVRAAATAPYLDVVAGALVGCDRATPRDVNGALALCDHGALRVTARADGWRARLGPDGPHRDATLGALPDATRAVGSLPPSLLAALAVAPRGLPSALDLVARERHARPAPPSAPLVAALSRRGDRVQLDLVAPTDGIAALAAMFAAMNED